MDAVQRHESNTRSLNASQHTLDNNDPEFLAACWALTEKPSLRTMPSAAERVEDSATRPNSAEVADLQKVIRRLEAYIEQLREALTESQAQVKENSEILRANEILRQSLADAHEQRSADTKALEDLMHQESSAQSEIATLSQALSAMTGDRAVDIADLREARRREAQVRAELQALQEDFDNAKVRQDDTTKALDAAIQRSNEARAELATAMTVVSNHDSAVEQLRQIITERDREIDELRQHLLEAEEARVADAAAFLESLNEHRT